MKSHYIIISIHALRGEGDSQGLRRSRRLSYFNPRPPRGGRRTAQKSAQRPHRFQSTPSAGRATVHFGRLQHDKMISIHALRGEGDRELTL